MTSEHAETNSRAQRGIRLLMGRQVVLQVLTFAGGIVLARVLTPAEFGLYAIATFLVGTMALFGDFGLAPSFIQRREELSDGDLRVGFTLQLLSTTLVVAVVLLVAPQLASLYPKAPSETVWLVRTLALFLYLTSWRSMSALQLERELRYDRLARIEVAESLVYQAVAVGLALNGFGVWSFVWAALMRGLLGTVMVFLAAPWKVRFGFDRAVARRILLFGVPFQLQNVVNQASSWVTPLFVGSYIGPQAVGYLTWASSNGRKPLMLVDSVMRVAFPHFSRLQHDDSEAERIIGRYLTYLLAITGFWFALLLTDGRDVVALVYTNKWKAAVPALIMYAATLFLEVPAWISGVALNARGEVRFTTRVMVVRSVAQILFSIPLVFWLGFNGVPFAILLASGISVPWLFTGLGRGVFGRILRSVAWLVAPIASALAVGFLCQRVGLAPQARAVITGVFVTCTYFVVALWMSPSWIPWRGVILSRVRYFAA